MDSRGPSRIQDSAAGKTIRSNRSPNAGGTDGHLTSLRQELQRQNPQHHAAASPTHNLQREGNGAQLDPLDQRTGSPGPPASLTTSTSLHSPRKPTSSLPPTALIWAVHVPVQNHPRPAREVRRSWGAVRPQQSVLSRRRARRRPSDRTPRG